MISFEDISIKSANHLVDKWHRHSVPVPRVQARFALQVVEYLPHIKMPDGGCWWQTSGILIFGNPCGRPTDPDIIELRRVAFKPKEIFGKYRRWYPKDTAVKHEISNRKIPILFDTHDIKLGQNYFGPVVSGRMLPSFFLKFGESVLKRRLPEKHTIWTYVLDEEKGRYLEEAGYVVDKIFTRRNQAKRRYTKTVEPFFKIDETMHRPDEERNRILEKRKNSKINKLIPKQYSDWA